MRAHPLPLGGDARGGRARARAHAPSPAPHAGTESSRPGRAPPCSTARLPSTRPSLVRRAAGPASRSPSRSRRCSRPCAGISTGRGRSRPRRTRPQQSSGRSSGSRPAAWPSGRSRCSQATSSAAERAVRRSCELLEELGEVGHRSLAAGQLAASLYALARLDEAHEWTETAAGLAPKGDVSSQMLWRQVRARILARRGHHAEAEAFAREAVVARGGNGHAQLPRERPCRPGGDLCGCRACRGRPRAPRAGAQPVRAEGQSRRGRASPAGDSRSSKTYVASPEATTRPVRIARRGHQEEGQWTSLGPTSRNWHTRATPSRPRKSPRNTWT